MQGPIFLATYTPTYTLGSVCWAPPIVFDGSFVCTWLVEGGADRSHAADEMAFVFGFDVDV